MNANRENRESDRLAEQKLALETRVKEIEGKLEQAAYREIQDVARAEKAEAWAAEAERQCQDALDAQKKAEAALAQRERYHPCPECDFRERAAGSECGERWEMPVLSLGNAPVGPMSVSKGSILPTAAKSPARRHPETEECGK